MPLLFVFDMDEVLYDYDWRVRMQELTRMTGLSLEELRERWWNKSGEGLAEAGGWQRGDEYLAAANSALGTEVDAEEWLRARRSAMTPRPDVIAIVERAADLGTVSLLTNNGVLVEERLADLAPEIAPIFEGHLHTTSFYGARKPDPAVFTALLAAYDADPRDTFFTDDLPDNIAGAESVGIHAHLFTDAASLDAAITDFAESRLG